MAGNNKSACTLFRGVLIHEPENFEAIERLGSSLFEMGQYHEALYWFWRGRKIDRRHPLALTNYGLTVSQLGHPDEGLSDLERAAAIADKTPEMSKAAKALVYNNLGNTLLRLDRFKEALAALGRGIRHDPADPFPHYNRGIALLRLNRQREAIASLDHSLGLRPPAGDSPSRLNEADARYNRGMGKLLLGDLKGGFEDYEARLTTSENTCPNLGLPADKKWQGESLEGKRILVHAEQGLGDELQFLRFLPLLRSPLRSYDPAEVLMISHKPVAPFAVAIPNVRILETGDDLEASYDVWVALMSLPHYLGIESEEMIPPPLLPVVYPDRRERLDKWRVELQGMGRPLEYAHGELRVGVCWRGQFQHKNDSHRSIDLKVFGRLFEAPCRFVSVQQMQDIDRDTFKGLQAKHPNLSALWLDDLRDTAAVIENLDLVISADTAVAHLAASMGKPTWILIPKFGTDWRWGMERTDSPWYPSARLIRQHRIGDWSGTIERLVADLTTMAARDRAA